jgi:cytochrome c
MNNTKRIGMVVAALLAASCGGGGGGDSGASGSGGAVSVSQPVTIAPAKILSAAKYAGFYLGTCDAIPKGVNLETNAALYGRLYQAVGSSTTATAPLTWRIDVYDTPSCAGSAVGYFENSNAANKVTVLGEVVIGGRTVDKVHITFGASDATNQPGLTPDSVLIGQAIRLSIPAVFFKAFQFADLWFLDAGVLLDGGDVTGVDGFPVTLAVESPNTRLGVPLPRPPEPCAAIAAQWQASSSLCTAPLMPKASGSSTNILDTVGLSTGSATFSCSNGTWSTPAATVCSTAPPPPPTFCPQASVTWNIGGNTCSGPTNEPLGEGIGRINIVNNTITGNTGFAAFSCNASGNWVFDSVWGAGSTCGPTPPPPPPITDPLQLATAKNCLACHTATDNQIAPSFTTIANFYRTGPPAPGVLETKIIGGGLGTFGQIPMPANPQVTDADLAILVPWILAQ